MKYPILYYPKCEPSQKWLRSILLFFDEIRRIIPADAEHVDSINTQRLIQLMPDAFKTVSPNEKDKNIDELNFSRLERAFALIKDQAGGTPFKSFTFEFDQEGHVSMQGNVWLSNAKLEKRVRELLFKYDLANDIFNPFTGSRPFGDTFPANEEASNLIVSYVADRIAQRTGLDTITDVEIPYTVQSLDALGASTASLHREGEGLLAAAIANIAVPESIERMDVHAFQEIRQTFQDIRAPFHDLIRSLSAHSKMGWQQNAAAMETRIQQAINEYQRQLDVYNKTVFAKKIDKWTPICLQGLLGMLMPLSSEAVQVIESTGIFSIEIMKEAIASQAAEMEHEKTFRMLCRLGKRIDRRDTLIRLI